MKTIYRQGDIILERVDEIPGEAKKVGDLFSLHGETGHAHEMKCEVFESKRTATQEKETDFISPVQTWVNVGEGGAIMVHPEHPPLAVAEGKYRQRRVRSYTYGKIREVTD